MKKWKEVNLEDAFSRMRNGASIRQSREASGIPITRIETIWNYEIDRNKFGYANIFEVEKYKDFVLQDGDILMSHINSLAHLGKSALYCKMNNETIIHGMNLLCLRPNIEKLNQRYAHYYFNSPKFRNQVPKISNQSVNQCSFSVSKLNKLKIPLPPLPLQKKIAEILDTADALRRHTQAQLDALDELARAVFLEMFGDAKLNPKKWRIQHLGNTFSVKPRIGTTTPAKEDGLLVVRVGELGKKEIELSKSKRVLLDENDTEKYRLQHGDILLARAIGSMSHLGKASIFFSNNEKVIFDSHVMRLRFNEKKVDFNFFYSWLKSYGGRARFMREAGQTAVQFNINSKQISRIKIPVPPLPLQTQFATIIENIEGQKAKLKKALRESEDLFGCLLQEVFG